MKTLVFIISLLGFNFSFAHAVVTDYSLKLKPIHADHADTIELRFNSHIELSLSQFFLVSKGDTHQQITATAGQKNGQIIIQLPPLNTGDYALKFKVFAADGHLTEDLIYFSVNP